MSSSSQSPVRRFFTSRLFFIIALPLAVLISFGYARSFYQGYKIKQEIKALQAEVATLERKKIESLDVLNYVMSDKFVEEKARTELGLKKPGESILVATNQEIARESNLEPSASLQIVSNPIKWWYYFVGKQPR